MKKAIVFGMALLVCLTAFSACGDPGDSGLPSGKLSGANDTGVKVQYIRTNGYIDGAKYPVVTVISSKEELEQYYDNYKGTYDFSSKSFVSSDTTIGFIDVIADYSDSFFAENYLVLVLLEEPSGSIRHRVEGIDGNGGITISRLLPEVGTADMAEWHIIIELAGSAVPEQFNVVLR